MTRILLLSSLLMVFFFQGCKTGSEAVQTDLRARDGAVSAATAERAAAQLEVITPHDPFEGLAPTRSFHDGRHFAALGLYEGDEVPSRLELVYGDFAELRVLSSPIEFETSLSEGSVVVFDSYGARYIADAGTPRLLSDYRVDGTLDFITEAGCVLGDDEPTLECGSEEAERRVLLKLFHEGERQVVVELDGLPPELSDSPYRLAATLARAEFLEPAAEEFQPEAIPAEVMTLAESSPELKALRDLKASEEELNEIDELFFVTRHTLRGADYFSFAYYPGCGEQARPYLALYRAGEGAAGIEFIAGFSGIAMLFQMHDRGELLGLGYSLEEGLFSMFRVGGEEKMPAFSFDGDSCAC